MKPTSLCALFCLLTFSALADAPAAAKCSRVHPGPSFAREVLLDTDTISASAGLPDGGGVLLLREFEWPHPTLRGYHLQLALPDGAGGLEMGPLTQVYSPGGRTQKRVWSRDLNGDGILDALVQWGGYVSYFYFDFFKGRSDGTFGDAVRWYPPPGVVNSTPIAGDFDRDGIQEFAFYLRERASFYLLEIVNGSWFWTITSGIGGQGSLVPGVDWNEDGIDDLVLAREATSSPWILIAFGSESAPFSAREEHVLTEGVSSFGSFNGRLIASERIRGGWWQPPRLVNVRELAAGVSGVREVWRYEGEPGDSGAQWSVDIDGDGLQDLQIYDLAGTDIHWGQESGAPGPVTRFAGIEGFRYSVDLNDDGLPEILTSEWTLIRQREARVLDDSVTATPVFTGFIDEPYVHLQVGDINEDGLDDLVTQTFYGDSFNVAISRGDGTFELHPSEIDPWIFGSPHLLDLDLDGHLDMLAGGSDLAVAWGRGDGTFDFEELQPRERYTSRVPIEIDGRPGVDILERWTDFSTSPETNRVRSFVFDAETRSWTPTGFVSECAPLSQCPYTYAPVDLDRDGLDDIVGTSFDGTSVSIFWRRGLGGRGFADPATLFTGLEWGYISARLDVADLDRDGTNDILYQAGITYGQDPGPNISLRGLGNQEYEIIWQGERMSEDWWDWEIEERLFDVDADGRMDLVAGHYHPFNSPSYYMEIRRGDGLGGFLPKEPSFWLAPTGEMGVFRHGGTRDFVELQSIWWGIGTINIELLPSTGYVLPEDNAPPTSELRLLPAGEDTWRPAFLPLDECDDEPQRRGALVVLPPLGEGALLTYEPAESRELLTFESPDGSRRGILLRGPSRREMLELFHELRARGGTPVEYMQGIRLRVSPESPRVSGAALPGARLLQRVVIEGGRAIEAEAFGPDADLVFAMQASDRSGKIGRSEASFLDTITSAARDGDLAGRHASLP